MRIYGVCKLAKIKSHSYEHIIQVASFGRSNMLKIGFLPHPHTGHLKPMLALASKLQECGHTAIVFQIPDVAQMVQESGIRFSQIGEKEFPKGTLAEWDVQLGKLKGIHAVRFTLQTIVFRQTETFFLELPRALRQTGIDGLVIDQMAFYGNLVAEYMRIPFIRVTVTPPLYRDDELPPCFTSWSFRPGTIGRLRNRLGNLFPLFFTRRIQKRLKKQRRLWNLNRNSSIYSKPLADITQLPICLEFPRSHIPSNLHYVGLLRTKCASSTQLFSLPIRKRPLIYASMGTLFNGREELFRTIAEACEGLNAELVISLGGGPLSHKEFGYLPGNPIVVPYMPQFEFLEHADLVITHAGLNTVLEALWHGVPMVAIPIANDQPGVAARLAWAGVAEVVLPNRISATKLNEAVHHVLSEPSYKRRAQTLQAEMRNLNGIDYAADVVEQSFRSTNSNSINKNTAFVTIQA